MSDYPHLRLHQSRIAEAERRHAVAVGATLRRRTLLTRVLGAFAVLTRPRRAGSPRAAVRYAGSSVAGERVE